MRKLSIFPQLAPCQGSTSQECCPCVWDCHGSVSREQCWGCVWDHVVEQVLEPSRGIYKLRMEDDTCQSLPLWAPLSVVQILLVFPIPWWLPVEAMCFETEPEIYWPAGVGKGTPWSCEIPALL
ncbi:hypothetical protein DV515_00014063 [Chloebia gouldiae]|uniref:Uncharacterized protein n=1 Tax=Chloebia gouldiae TaxID=44316 RepID=A0A3L8RZ29_CHLGU|nr:hypothetical protein DV515_00014063 [Chloebia gouldiae]